MVLSEIMLKPPNGSESRERRPRQGMQVRSASSVSCTSLEGKGVTQELSEALKWLALAAVGSSVRKRHCSQMP